MPTASFSFPMHSRLLKSSVMEAGATKQRCGWSLEADVETNRHRDGRRGRTTAGLASTCTWLACMSPVSTACESVTQHRLWRAGNCLPVGGDIPCIPYGIAWHRLRSHRKPHGRRTYPHKRRITCPSINCIAALSREAIDWNHRAVRRPQNNLCVSRSLVGDSSEVPSISVCTAL